jgi:thiosulfate/3-mercaptopyruvate sulfurtransferase
MVKEVRMYNTIISAQSLQENYQPENWVILDCRFDLADPEKGQSLYLQGHIENAQYANLHQQLSGVISPNSGRHPLPEISEITQFFSSVGIGENKQVVVYDDCSGAMAARAWWLLQWLGHTNVAVLDGGLQEWTKLNKPLSVQPNPAQAAHFVRHSSQYVAITTDQICSGQYQLIDARANARFRGEVEPIDPVAGHIPNALNQPFTENLTLQGLFRSKDDLVDVWQAQAKDETVHMCGSGVTACHNILAMKHAGFKPSKLYVGSWSEWIKDSARAVAKD